MKTNKLTMTLLALIALMATPLARAADDSAMMEPVKSVYDNYLKIQETLAKDSLDGVPEKASAIAKAIKGDDMKMLSPDIAKQAEMLAEAKDVKAARKEFKPLSESLIKYLADHKVKTGSYTEVFCPMAGASWLQADKKINNPYMGKEMPGCGEVKRTF